MSWILTYILGVLTGVVITELYEIIKRIIKYDTEELYE